MRTVVSICVICRKRRADTINPMMADLLRERLAYREPPSPKTGSDYFGPFYVSGKRSTEKRWGFLFTCLTTRAIHFEIVPSTDTSSCVLRIERFAARRALHLSSGLTMEQISLPVTKRISLEPPNLV